MSYNLVDNEKYMVGKKIKYESILDRKNNIGTLVIYDLNKSDIDEVIKGYKCQVSNKYGTTSLNITIKESKFPFEKRTCKILSLIIFRFYLIKTYKTYNCFYLN